MMGQKRLTLLLLISSLGVSQELLADNVAKVAGVVNVSGAIIDKGCDIASDSRSLNIDLGNVDVSAFDDVAGSTAGASEIEIPLTNCPLLQQGVGVVFDGPSDFADSSLLALPGKEAAGGVAIAFYESDGTTEIPLHRQSEFKPIAVGQRDVLLRYVTKYKSTAMNVSAGEGDAIATFTLVYN
jgi:major type 1 subunit fimbrin (pilin)